MPVFMLPTRADVNEPSEDIRRRYYADGVTETPDNGFWHQSSADKGIQCLSMSESRLFRAEDLIHLISVSLLLRLKPWPGNFSPLTKIWFYELLIYFSPQWFNKHSNIYFSSPFGLNYSYLQSVTAGSYCNLDRSHVTTWWQLLDHLDFKMKNSETKWPLGGESLFMTHLSGSIGEKIEGFNILLL